MAETAFDLTYEGDAIGEGRMPVRDLAPALLALGEIFADASSVVAPNRPPASLEIEATGEGSFVVHLVISGWDHIIDIFSSKDAVALLGLREAIVGTGGLFALIHYGSRRVLSAVNESTEPGNVVLSFDDGTTLTVPKSTWELYGDVEIRKKASEVVKPVSRGDVEKVSFQVDKETTVSIGSKDASAYDPPALVTTAPAPLGAEETPLVVSIVSVAFKGDNKWRLSDGTRTFYALIRDEAFLLRVENGREAFRNGDMLRCQVRIVQTSDAEGLHTEYEVLEVIEHIPRPPQLRIDLPSARELPSEAGEEDADDVEDDPRQLPPMPS